jgi:hypothetical protein
MCSIDMNSFTIYKKGGVSVSLKKFVLVISLAAALVLSFGASAFAFNPQPDPPGFHLH